MKKTTLSLLAALAALSASAQSFANFPFTFTSSGSTNFIVATNQTATMRSLLTTAVTGATLSFAFPSLQTMTVNLAATPQPPFLDHPIMGPCTVTLSFTASGSASVNALVEFNTVNASANPGGTMVLPQGFSGSIALQSSINLTTWSTMTNAAFAKTNANRFFRMSLAIP